VKRALVLTSTILAALIQAGEPASDTFIIGPSARIQQQQVNELQIVEAFRTLAKDSASNDKARQTAIATLQRDKVKSTESMLAAFNPLHASDAAVRIGALQAMQTLKPVGERYSLALGTIAASDPVNDVRAAAISTIKSRGDDFAIRSMIGHLVSSFDQSGSVRDKLLAARASDALRGLNDKRVYQALLYYVTLELRLTNVSAGNLTTRQIDTFSVPSGQNPFPAQLALPIQTPELTMTRVYTTVVAPAVGALKLISGEDFGDDWDKWGKWVAKQK